MAPISPCYFRNIQYLPEYNRTPPPVQFLGNCSYTTRLTLCTIIKQLLFFRCNLENCSCLIFRLNMLCLWWQYSVVLLPLCLPWRSIRGADVWLHSFFTSLRWRWVLASHLCCFMPRERTLIPLEWEAEWAAELFWMFSKQESFGPSKNQASDFAAHS
jgi:hypothetical protein